MELNVISKDDISKLGQLLQDISNTTEICIDVETTSLDPITGKLLLFQIKAGENTYIIDCLHSEIRTITYVVQIIKDSKKLCIGHNIKFDIKYLYTKTGELIENVYDTSLAENIINAGVGKKFYSLNDLTSKYCDVVLDKDVRESFYKEEIITFTQEQLIYSALDVKYLEAIKEKQLLEIAKRRLIKILNLEMLLVPVVADMEVTGIKIDVEKWKENNQKASEKVEDVGVNFVDKLITLIFEKIEFETLLDVYDKLAIPAKTKKLRNQLIQITDRETIFIAIKNNLNLDSPYQLLKCFHILGFEVPDTNEKTINKIDDPLIEELLQYREYSKKKSSFGEKFLEHINKVTGKIHTNFNQLGPATGRFSSDKPNLQNIERESVYRDCFVADDGFYLVTADYSQAELRLLGDVSREPKFIKAYEEDRDLHIETAVELFELDREKIDKKLRQHAKNTNFAVVYGSTEWGLYRNFGIPLETGAAYLAAHRKAYPDLYRFIDAMGTEIARRFYSITPMGRRRYFNVPEFTGDYRQFGRELASIKRRGINHIIQGGSADITKLAMVSIYYNNPFGKDKFKLLLTVHDELVIMVANEIPPEQSMEFILKMMNDAGNNVMKVIRSKVDIKHGMSWSK